MIELDGLSGEGGGQILRIALTLAMVTGQAFRIRQIRARRAKPGLMRHRGVAVQAASQICGARVAGAALGSQALEFIPGPVRGGDYRFAIGTAGSCTLVLQTVLPADEVSMHARTNAQVIEPFLPVRFDVGQHDGVDCCTLAPR
jgi:RNA 3'-terminal phosphate cyclase (ATP)